MSFNPRQALAAKETSVETSPVWSTLGIIFACIAVAGVAGYCVAVYG